MNTPAAIHFEAVVKLMLQKGGDDTSDLVFVVGQPPQVELNGELAPVEIQGLMPTLKAEHTQRFAEMLIGDNERLVADFRDDGSCDTSYSLGDAARFRVNVFRQFGRHAIVMRKLSTEIPSLESLRLPPVFKEIVKEKNGIVLCTGATGSGKSTTLAAMLNEINATARVHVITLEDPIEFLHPQKCATFSQRELGKDFSSFSMGLRAALRQAPKVILVGEIRDLITMEIALTAAETGHIVYATLHTVSAGQSINRIIGMFDQAEQQHVRERLASTLRYIVSQRLAPRNGGGRQLLTEIMGSNLRTREIIQLGEGENRNIQDAIEAGVTQGWHSFEQDIIHYFGQGVLAEETAVLFSVNKARLRQMLDLAKKKMGAPDDTSHNFRLDHLDGVKSGAADAPPASPLRVEGATPPRGSSSPPR